MKLNQDALEQTSILQYMKSSLSRLCSLDLLSLLRTWRLIQNNKFKFTTIFEVRYRQRDVEHSLIMLRNPNNTVGLW